MKKSYSSLHMLLQKLSSIVMENKWKDEKQKGPLLVTRIKHLYSMHELVRKTLTKDLTPFITPGVMKGTNLEKDANRPLFSSEQPYLETIQLPDPT